MSFELSSLILYPHPTVFWTVTRITYQRLGNFEPENRNFGGKRGRGLHYLVVLQPYGHQLLISIASSL